MLSGDSRICNLHQRQALQRNPRPSLVPYSRASAHRLGLGADGFALQASLLGSSRGLGRTSSFGNPRYALDELLQTLESSFAIGFLATSLLGFDDDHSLFGYAMIAFSQQAFFESFRQRGSLDIEEQMDRSGNLVHVLPAGSLGSNRFDFDLPQWNANGFRNSQHENSPSMHAKSAKMEMNEATIRSA